jgi:hypothetical protein
MTFPEMICVAFKVSKAAVAARAEEPSTVP